MIRVSKASNVDGNGKTLARTLCASLVHVPCTVARVSVPLTTRLSEETVAALEQLVASGRAPSKGAIVAEAVRMWLDRHDEDAIAASYRRAYADPDPGHEALLDALAEASAECLADQ